MVWLNIFAILLLVLGAQAAEQKKSSAESSSSAKSAPSPVHPLEAWFTPVEQAEAVERELLKLIYNDLSLPAKSLMGQFKLVLAKELKKKHDQVIYSCQRFSWQSSQPGAYSIYQACLPKERPEIIYVEISAVGNLEVNFYLQNLIDVVGFGSSILKRSTRCVLSQKDGELHSMKCLDLGNSRSPIEVMMLDEILYRKDGLATLTASGKFYKELLPSRSIGVYVPREGQVSVQIKSLYKKPVVKISNPPVAPSQPVPLKTTEGRERLPGELGAEPERSSQNREGAFAPPPSNRISEPIGTEQLTPVTTVPKLIPPGAPLPGMDSEHPLPVVPEGGDFEPNLNSPVPEATINRRGRFEIKPVVPNEGTDHNSKP